MWGKLVKQQYLPHMSLQYGELRLSVMHILTRSSITVSRVSATFPSVSLLLGFNVMLSVSLVSRVTARSLHDNMFGRQSPSGEWS